MSQEQYPDATPKHEDGTRILQPFAFTTGGTGDFRPMVEKVVEDGETVDPKGESATVTVDSPVPEKTETKSEPPSTANAQPQTDTSEVQVKPAPSLAGRARKGK